MIGRTALKRVAQCMRRWLVAVFSLVATVLIAAGGVLPTIADPPLGFVDYLELGMVVGGVLVFIAVVVLATRQQARFERDISATRQTLAEAQREMAALKGKDTALERKISSTLAFTTIGRQY